MAVSSKPPAEDTLKVILTEEDTPGASRLKDLSKTDNL